MQTHWNDVARARGFPNMESLLIKKYVLEGRGSGWICDFLRTSRWTVINLLKECDIPLRGNRIVVLSQNDRIKWQARLFAIGYRDPEMRVSEGT